MKTSKKIILAIVAVLVIAVGSYFGYYYVHYMKYDGYKKYLKEKDAYEEGTEFTSDNSKTSVPGFQFVCENDNFELYTDTATTYVAVYDKRNGEITYSNPTDADEDVVTNEVNRPFLKSQLVIDYYNVARQLGTMNNAEMAVELGQYETRRLKNGIRYVYTMGDLSSETGIVPRFISEERFEEFVGRMSEKDAKTLRSNYAESKKVKGFRELPETVNGAATLRKFNAMFESAGYTEEDFIADMEASGVEGAIPVSFEIPLEYRLVEDGLQVNVPTDRIVENGGGKIYKIQTLPMMGAVKAPESKLTPTGANAAAATEAAVSDGEETGEDEAEGTGAEGTGEDAEEGTGAEGTGEDTEEGTGAEDTGEDAAGETQAEEAGGDETASAPDIDTSVVADDEITGYMVVPNGSGSIIRFNNGRSSVAEYSQYIYGIDPLSADYSIVETTKDARLPVFGIQKEAGKVQAKDYGMFTVIEQGDSLGQVTAYVSNKLNSYNYAYSSFILRGYEKLSMFGSTGNESDLPVLEANLYEVNIQLHYAFLDETYKGYSGMANYYREKLLAEGNLKTAETDNDDIPFYMDVIGGVQSQKSFAGIQYDKTEPVTSFSQAGTMLDSLAEDGIGNVSMNYLGWCNGGYYHDVPDKITGLGVLGGKKDLSSLTDKIEGSGGRIYGDIAFQEVTYVSDRYKYNAETSRYYGGGFIASFGQVSPVTLRQTAALGYRETLYDLLSPKFLPRYVSAFAKEIKDYNLTGVSLRDLGSELHSDKKRTEFIDREAAKNIVEAQLAILDGTGKNLLMNNANAYALKYTDEIINIPVSANDYFIVDEEIPFYQMVIHGSINYGGDEINLSDSTDEKETALRLIEYGASPHFILSYSSSNELKYTGLNRMYSTMYTDWEENAADIYASVNEALRNVAGSAMLSHEIIQTDVKKVTYENGVIFYINKSGEDVTVDGISVPAGSYVMGGAN